MLNSAEHELFPAYKYLNDNNSRHFNINEQENSIVSLSEPKKPEFLDIVILMSV